MADLAKIIPDDRLFEMDITEIQRFLPHRPPFLLIDRIIQIKDAGSADCVGNESVAIKNFSFNEEFFKGHFPGLPVVPGVLLVEAMAQGASFCLYPPEASDPEAFPRKYRFILASISSARFRVPVVPGDTVRLEGKLVKAKSSLRVFECKALVDGKKVAEVDIMANMTPTGQK